MDHRRLTLFAITLAAAASCTSRDANDGGSQSSQSPVDSGTVPTDTIPWFDGAAPLLLVPAQSNDRALIVAADSLAADMEEGPIEQPGTLIRLDGSTIPVRVTVGSGGEGCVDATLDPSPSASWGVGFVGRAPNVLRVDSLRGMSRQDSTALSPTIFRIASGIPNAPGGRFAGLPFSLVEVWRVRMADGAMILVATTKRQLNQEDSPLEERTLIIAEGDSSGAGYGLMYSKRSTGPEETVEGSDLLAAVALPGRGEAQLLFAHDFGGQTSYSIAERTGRARWKLRWTSRRLSC